MRRKRKGATVAASAEAFKSGLDNRLPSGSTVIDVPELLVSYRNYLAKVQGLALRTCDKYLYFAGRLLDSQITAGDLDWSSFTADRLREFVAKDAAPRKGFGPHGTATSVRSFLRFLVSQGFIAPGLELAIPKIRHWAKAALPERLTELEVEHLCATSLDGTAIGSRNYVIILLLTKLGLRANEVARLQLEDVDWSNGCLLLRAPKSHRERSLPLRKEVGEALINYLQTARPVTMHREVFLRHAPTVSPLKTPSAITKIVKRIMVRASIERRSSGAHLLRHTAATQMVNQGATFKDVADVLGHQSLQTTAIYAKLDLARLEQVALPWPGGEQ